MARSDERGTRSFSTERVVERQKDAPGHVVDYWRGLAASSVLYPVQDFECRPRSPAVR